MPEELRIEVLGGLRITQGGTPVTGFVSSKAPALLAYLAVTARPHFRAALAAVLWSELPDTAARMNLRHVLSNLRHHLAPHLVITRDTVAFDRTSAYWLDLEQFETTLGDGNQRNIEQLHAAVTRYHGDFLEGFYVRDAPMFEEWVAAERERLRHLALHGLHELVNYHTARQEYAAGIDHATRLLQLDPWREDAHRQLIVLLARSGQVSAALAQYDACCRILEAELGATPSEETIHLYEDVRDGVIMPDPRPPAEVAAPAPHPARIVIPSHPTRFLGREVELVQIAQRLSDPACRLLTLVGPGGIGKTRLALQAAADAIAEFADGVVFVPLVAVDTPPQMLAVIADALGVPLGKQQDPLDQVLAYVRDKRVLLVLDNVEQLHDGFHLLAVMLERALGVTVLATSRERLGMQAEWLLDVHGLPYPLTLPSAGDLPDIAPLETYGAVQLFVQRAMQVQPDFVLSATTIVPVIRICQLVDGMPLGIELAAAWVRMVSPTEIADEVAENLDFLNTSLWDVPVRHRSLRAVFDHSWDLLSNQERHILAQLAVFQGGFGAAAAREVTGARLPMLGALSDKSLVQRDTGGRYALHPILRQFAAERLADMPDVARTIHGKHSRYYLHFAVECAAMLRGQGAPHAMAEARAEFDNIRQGWQWIMTETDLGAILRASHAVADVYGMMGLFAAGATVFAAAVAQVRPILARAATPDQAVQHTLGALLVESARFLTYQAQFAQATAAVQEAVALAQAAHAMGLEAAACRQWGEILSRQSDYLHAQMQLERARTLAQSAALPYIEIDALLNLGQLALWQGNYAAVHTYHEDALERCRAAGDRRGEGSALNGLGLLALWQSDGATARALQEQALECYRAVGNHSGEGFVLTCLGHTAVGQRCYTEAWRWYQQALNICRSIGDRFGESLALACIGYVPLYQGDYDSAQRYYEQALHLHREIGDRRGESDMLAQLGLVLHLLGDNVQAYECSHEALRIAEEMGNQPFQARALTFLGHAAADLQRWEEAVAAYQRALDLRRMLNQPPLALEPLAGLARIALAQGDLEHAHMYCTDILAQLATGTLDGMFEPLRVYLTCYQVLHVTDDPRADEVLRTASRVLHAWAGTISDPQGRFAFLNHVAAHREIEDAYAKIMNRGEVAAAVDAGAMRK